MMIDKIPNWMRENAQGRYGNAGPGFRGNQAGNPGTKLPMDHGNIPLLVLNSLAFGEDESVNMLIHQEMMPQLLSRELVEYPFVTPQDEDIWGPINIGICEDTGAPAGIFPHEVHTFLCGSSGSGKSTLFRHLIRQHLGIMPILIIDFENEYRDYPELMADGRLKVLSVDDFVWNPLEVPQGMDPRLYMQVFCSIFADQCGLLIASKSFLLDAIDKLYRLFGVYNGGTNFPSLYELGDLLREILKRYRATSRFTTYGEVCLNRIDGFILSVPRVLDCSVGMPLHLLTKGSLILQLHGVDFEYQSLLVSLILSWICSYRIANGLRNNPEHNLAVFIDEAQRLFDSQLERRQYQGIPTISHLIATVRKYNLKLFVAAQQPSLVASSLKANSYCKVHLSLGEFRDIMDMSSSMFLTREQTFFSKGLERGQAIVKYGGGRWTEPFVVRIPHQE